MMLLGSYGSLEHVFLRFACVGDAPGLYRCLLVSRKNLSKFLESSLLEICM